MKTIVNVTRNLTVAALTLAAVTFVTAPLSSMAQEKGAERLIKLNRPAIATPATTEAPAMSCPKCTETVASVAQPMGRGGRVESASILRHQCPACHTKIVTEGTGKQAKNVVKHDCKMDGSSNASCCATKKS